MNPNIKLSHQIQDLSHLTNEEKLIEIILNIGSKQTNSQIVGQNNLYILDDEVRELLKDSLDGIKYIADSPRFEIIYNDDDKIMSKSTQVFSIIISSKDDVIRMFKKNSNNSFIFYNLQVDTFSGKYMLRGAFISDLQITQLSGFFYFLGALGFLGLVSVLAFLTGFLTSTSSVFLGFALALISLAVTLTSSTTGVSTLTSSTTGVSTLTSSTTGVSTAFALDLPPNNPLKKENSLINLKLFFIIYLINNPSSIKNLKKNQINKRIYFYI